jgi:hypothetical protein
MALSPRAAAQSASGGGEDAQLLFDEGLKYMLDGELKMGCAFIKRSLDVDPRPGTIFTLAECYARAGKIASAVEYYDEYLNVYSRMPPDEQERQRARSDVSHKERSKLVKSVPWITMELPTDAPDGVVVTMDDEPFPNSLFGVAIAVDPGKHWFTTRAPGGPLARTELTVEPGTRKTHVLELHTAGSEGSQPEEPIGTDSEGPSSSGISPLVWVFGGLGVAGVATATVTGIMLIDLASGIHDQCDEVNGTFACGDPDDPDAQRALDDVALAQDTLGPINTVGIAVGVIGLGTAAVLLLTGSDSTERQGSNVSAGASVGPEGGSITISGQF